MSERKLAGDTLYIFILPVAQLVLGTDTIPLRPFFILTALWVTCLFWLVSIKGISKPFIAPWKHQQANKWSNIGMTRIYDRNFYCIDTASFSKMNGNNTTEWFISIYYWLTYYILFHSLVQVGHTWWY